MKTLLLALALLSAFAQAADNVNITVRGILTRPPCVLSSGTTLTAEFNNVRTDQVGSTGTVAIPVLMVCPAGSSLNVSFTSSNGTYTGTVARTNADNLGVSLLWASDNTAANLAGVAKTYSSLTGPVDISLNAQLIARGALAPGAFSSSIVMTINYL